MSHHYKKDGSLDMRYSSSKAAASSGYGSGGSRGSASYSGSSYGGSSYGGSSAYGGSYGNAPSSGYSDGLHHKKDGSLDMRYSSSKAAASSEGTRGSASYSGSSYGGSSAYGGSYGNAPSSDGLHHKKDGSLDMRYKSSKEAYGSLSPSYQAKASAPVVSSTCPVVPQSTELHCKKDGSLDMRYKSSKEAVGQMSLASQPADNLHLKKDGSLDMRYKTSKLAEKELTAGIRAMNLSNNKSGASTMNTHAANVHNIPSVVPLKKDGTPDMRKKEAKVWVQQQASLFANNRILPCWVPTKKDGSVNAANAIGRAFVQAQPVGPSSQFISTAQRRKEYWDGRLMEEFFRDLLRKERDELHSLPPPTNLLKAPSVSTHFMSQNLSQISAQSSVASSALSIPSSMTSSALSIPSSMTSSAMSIPSSVTSSAMSTLIDVQEIDYSSLHFSGEIVGKGAFGVVQKATWNSIKVAVKILHLTELTRKEKADFLKELRIHAMIGNHQNLVYLHGHCVNPPCIVMELVECGNLSFLLHYCMDPEVEVKMTDGRVKRILMCGVAEGMRQLHEFNIIHGDLKPQNILVTSDYTTKITDFGLSTLRGKTSSSLRSQDIDDDDDDDEGRPVGIVGGTAGYMAPELLDSTSPPDYPVDVYAFGIVLNEVVSEEEPYSDQYANFAARGPFGPVNYARLGKRPTINKSVTSAFVENVIVQCWAPDPAERPTFEMIRNDIRHVKFEIHDTIHP